MYWSGTMFLYCYVLRMLAYIRGVCTRGWKLGQISPGQPRPRGHLPSSLLLPRCMSIYSSLSVPFPPHEQQQEQPSSSSGSSRASAPRYWGPSSSASHIAAHRKEKRPKEQGRTEKHQQQQHGEQIYRCYNCSRSRQLIGRWMGDAGRGGEPTIPRLHYIIALHLLFHQPQCYCRSSSLELDPPHHQRLDWYDEPIDYEREHLSAPDGRIGLDGAFSGPFFLVYICRVLRYSSFHQLLLAGGSLFSCFRQMMGRERPFFSGTPFFPSLPFWPLPFFISDSGSRWMLIILSEKSGT